MEEENVFCEYSGLPSPKWYEAKKTSTKLIEIESEICRGVEPKMIHSETGDSNLDTKSELTIIEFDRINL